jgi:hypothetical protein
MSCEWCRLRRVTRSALPFVLVLTTPSISFSESRACHVIRRGESAAELSRRITGESWNAYQSWFQIMDASSRFIPKSQYDRIRPGWRACIVKEPPRPIAVGLADRAVQPPPPVLADTRGPVGPVGDDDLALLRGANARRLIDNAGAVTEVTEVWIGATMILALFGWRVLDGYAGRRKHRLLVMSQFADRFVREFERPLIQRPTEPPLQSRLRLSPARARLKILLAPGQGRRYPNLSDHRKNVEYDVVRVLQSLADDSFVPDSLYSQAGWVVVSFRFKVDRKHTGVACISSF